MSATLTTTIRAENKFSGTLQQLASEAAQIRKNIIDGNAKLAASSQNFASTLKTLAENTEKSWEGLAVGIKSALDLLGSVGTRFRDVYGQFIRFEDASTRLAPLVGGLENATALCRDLRDEAANGVLPFETLVSITSRLSTVFDNTADLKKWVSIFHNLSAGTGLDINELIGTFTKLKAAGRVTGEFPEMFAQKGINLFGELEKQTGLTTTELRKMASAGTLSFSEIERAIESVSVGTGKFAARARAMSNTFGGTLGTLRSNFDILKAEISAPIAERLTPMFQNLAKWVRDAASSAGEFSATVFTLARAFAPIAIAIASFKVAAGVVGTLTGAFRSLFAIASAGFAKMKADALTVASAMRGVGSSTVSAGTAFKAGARLAGGVGTLAVVGADVALQSYISSAEKTTSAAEHFSQMNKRLQKYMSELEAASSEEEFLRLRKSAEEFADFFYAQKNKWEKAAGLPETKSPYLQLLTFNEAISTLAERKTIEFAEAQKERAALEKAARTRELHAEAYPEFAEIEKNEREKTLQKELTGAKMEDVPALLLNQSGLDVPAGFTAEQARRAAQQMHEFLSVDAAFGTLTPEKVREYSEMLALAEKLETAEKNITEQREAQEKIRFEVEKKYEEQKEKLLAEIDGNEEALAAIEQRSRQEQLFAEFASSGDLAFAEKASREIAELEAAKKRNSQKEAAGEKSSGALFADGAGTVGTAQASVGGGRSVFVGAGLIDVAREQLATLNLIARNTSEKQTAVQTVSSYAVLY